ncbi:MAG: hypothetical protein R3290_03125 [Acidimicrobiia bacterium]|nr:hypothetical protein [Acidimicrobiia bacterium]
MPLPPDDHRLRDDHHPTPFSAEEIRAACRPGRRSTYRVEQAGGDPVLSVSEFVEGDAETGQFVATTTDLAGEPIGEPKRGSATWGDLQAHASYPEDGTTVVEERREVPAGTYDCWRYTRSDGDTTTTAWFAKTLPGPPIDRIVERDGTVISRMVLLDVTES